MLLFFVLLLGLLAAAIPVLVLLLLLDAAWKAFRRRRRASETRSEHRLAEQLTAAALAAVAPVTTGSETLPAALVALATCQGDSGGELAAQNIAKEATLRLQADRPAEAFVLARFAIAMGDSHLSEDERLACRRVLLGAPLPAGALASGREIAVAQVLDQDRRAAPGLWAEISWWSAEQAVAQRPQDPAAAAEATRIYIAVHRGLTRCGRNELRAEALRRLARARWDSRATSPAPRLREEQAICCTRRAMDLLPDAQDFTRAGIGRQLGVYWYYRQAGERAQNLEESIACFAAAAEVQRLSGGDFALTQHWLGAAFLNRVRGDRSRNLERAISCFQQTRHLEVSDQMRKRTQELADRAVGELWGRAAVLAAAAGPAATSTVVTPIAAPDLSGLLPAAAAPEPRLPGGSRQSWRWAQRIFGLSPLAVLVVFILFFRHPLVWLTAMLLVLGTGMSLLAANSPRAMEEYSHFAFLGTPRFALEMIRAYRTFKLRFGDILGFLLGIRAFLAQPQSMLPRLRQGVAALDEKRFPMLRLVLLHSYGHTLQANPVGEVGESCEEVILYLQSYRGAFRRKAFAFLARLNDSTLAEAYLRRRRGDRADNARHALAILREQVLPYAELRAAGWKRKFWTKRKRTLYLLGEAHRRLAAAEGDETLRRCAIEQAVDCYGQALACKAPPRRARLASSRGRLAAAARQAGQRDGERQPASAARPRGLRRDDWEPLVMDAESCAGLADLWYESEPADDAAATARQRSLLEAARTLVAQAAALAAEHTGFALAGIARQAIEIDLRLARLERRAGGSQSRARCEPLYRQAAGAAMREGASALVLEALAGLGELLYRAREDGAAIDVLSALMNYQDRIRWQVMSIRRRAELLRESVEDFDRLITALLRQGRGDEAAVLSERSRSRTLVDLLQLRGVLPRQPAAPPRHRLRDDIVRLTLLESEAGADDARYEVMRNLHDEDLAPLEQEAELVAAAQPLTLSAIKALAREAGAILLLLRVTAERSFAFLVFPDGALDIVETARFTAADLDRVADVMERRGARSSWRTALDGVLAELSAHLLGPVRERLQCWQARAAGPANRLVIVPNRGLAVVPLHACFWDLDGRRSYLIDEFVVSYAPNLSVLARCLERDADRRERPSLLAVGNTLPAAAPLPAAERKCEHIEQVTTWTSALVRLRDAATRAEILERAPAYSCIHFACHASYLTNDPFNSHLALAGGTHLTLGEIVQHLALPRAWLVALSACETGRLDSHEVADESLGLATGFLIAGAPTVWCTLWKVDDDATALLMARAYQILFATGKPKCEALREAQIWLRDLTAAEATPLIANLRSRDLHSSHESEAPDGAHPFAHPASWAAYQSVGA